MKEKTRANLFTSLKVFITVLGSISAIIALYTYFFQTKKVDIQFELVSSINVLDINENLSRLDIIYDKTSLKDNNYNLKIITIRIVNVGTESILKEFFDSHDPLGVMVDKGQIIEVPQIIETSSNYVKNNLILTFDTANSKVTFNEIILDAKESFVVKLLILYKTDLQPVVLPIGKIAGIKTIGLLNKIETDKEEHFLYTVFKGNILIQTVKLLSYLIIAVLIILIITFTSIGLKNLNTKFRNSKIIKGFKNNSGYELKNMDDVVFNRFKKNGVNALKSIYDIIKDEKTISKKYEIYLNENKAFEPKVLGGAEGSIENIRYYPSEILFERHIFSYLFDDGFIYKNEDDLVVNQRLKETLRRFLDYLVERKILKSLNENDNDDEVDNNNNLNKSEIK